MRLAAKHATSWNVGLPPARALERMAELEPLCRDRGRAIDDIELSLHLPVAVAERRDDALARAKTIAELFGQDPTTVEDDWLVGTPDELVAKMGRYTAIGFSEFILGFGHPYDHRELALLRDEVLPALGWSPAS
jgi:alkanesulfonate monooxygenase SsuD/methylene tetrahydromethanopterin reductase-like flavin-dependent oxidoreductase (luciferase family)